MIKIIENGERYMIFETQVESIGKEAIDFYSEKMLILFGEEVTSDLQPYCFQIKMSPLKEKISQGMYLGFDNQLYEITAVGSVVQSNLEMLGHVTIRFDGKSEAAQAGTIHVSDDNLPNIKIGTKIFIDKK